MQRKPQKIIIYKDTSVNLQQQSQARETTCKSNNYYGVIANELHVSNHIGKAGGLNKHQSEASDVHVQYVTHLQLVWVLLDLGHGLGIGHHACRLEVIRQQPLVSRVARVAERCRDTAAQQQVLET